MDIKVTINDKELKGFFQKLKQKLGNLKPLMSQIGETVRTSVKKNFEVGGRPKWTPSKKKSGQTLIERGRLMNSFFFRAFSDRAIVGTNVVYAAIHQFGGTIQRKAGTQTLFFKQFRAGKRKGQTLFSKERKATFGMKASYGAYEINIPARPFLAVQDEDWAEIKRLAIAFLAEKQA